MTTGHAPVGGAMQYYSGLLKQLNLMEQPRNKWPGSPRDQWPSLRNHTDPTDILKPEVYEIDSPACQDPKKENKRAMREFCG